MTVSPLQVPCLGRTFQLGMIYDSYSDNLISEITLWDVKTLEKYQSCISKFTSNHEILDNNMLNEKYNYLNVTGDFKLSCLVGLVKVSGSANFLKDVPSLQQVRVCFKYWSNLKYKELFIDQLKDIPCTIGTSGTHIVTAISYGAEAIFVFDYTLQDNEERQEIITFMKDTVENLPYVYIDANGDIKCNLDILNKDKINKICCKLYTDIHIGNNPTTFQDAVMAYKLIVEKSSNNENTVPKKVWLYPLKDLKNEECNSYVEISTSSINAVQSVIENLTLLELTTENYKREDTSKAFVVFQKELNRFATCIVQYKMTFLHEVGILIPVIRSAKRNECELISLLQKYKNSSFSTEDLQMWLKNKKKEIDTIKIFLQNVQEVEHAFLEDHLDEATNDLEYNYIVCLEFNVCGKHDEYVEQLYTFSQNRHFSNLKLNPTKLWYKDDKIKGKIRKQLMKFKNFFTANKGSSTTKCLLTHNIDEDQNEGATICVYELEDCVRRIFIPPEECRKPELVDQFSDSLEIRWNQPDGDEVTNYTVYYCENDNLSSNAWMKHTTINTNTSVTINNLKPDTEYCFKVCANCKVGSGETSKPSEALKTKNCISDVVSDFKGSGKIVKEGNPSTFKIPLILVYEDTNTEDHTKDKEEDHTKDKEEDHTKDKEEDHTKDKEEDDDIAYEQHLSIKVDDIKITKYVVGKDKTFYTAGSEKVLMVLGATGAGKTTLINSMINYLFGITFDDDFRLQLISENSGRSQAHSQTSGITSYTIYNVKGFKLPYPLTIIDTPGYGDTEGLQRDKVITMQIKTFFSQSGEHGIDHLNGVGFVVQSALARLTKTQEYIFDSILSLFGKDVKQNIFIMVTFADAQRPPVLDAINKAKISYNTYYTFNNSAIFADKSPENENFTQLFWKMGNTSFQRFFDKFAISQDVSLTCTREVLDQRKKLDVTVYAIQRKIELGVAKIEELENEKKIMLTHKAQIEANQKFTYDMPVVKQRQKFVTPGTYVTNCVNCNFTCHYPCYIADDEKKFYCWAMENRCDTNTKCKVCIGHCSWIHHFNNGYVFELYDDVETRTSDKLKKKYQAGVTGKASVQKMIENIKTGILETRDDVKKKMKKVKECLTKLNEIALRTNPLTEEHYLEMLIRSEEEQKKAGYLDRIKFYQESLQEAQIISIAKGVKNENPTLKKYEQAMTSSLDEK